MLHTFSGTRAPSHPKSVPFDVLLVQVLEPLPLVALPEVLHHERHEAHSVDHQNEDDVLVRVGRVVVIA